MKTRAFIFLLYILFVEMQTLTAYPTERPGNSNDGELPSFRADWFSPFMKSEFYLPFFAGGLTAVLLGAVYLVVSKRIYRKKELAGVSSTEELQPDSSDKSQEKSVFELVEVDDRYAWYAVSSHDEKLRELCRNLNIALEKIKREWENREVSPNVVFVPLALGTRAVKQKNRVLDEKIDPEEFYKINGLENGIKLVQKKPYRIFQNQQDWKILKKYSQTCYFLNLSLTELIEVGYRQQMNELQRMKGLLQLAGGKSGSLKKFGNIRAFGRGQNVERVLEGITKLGKELGEGIVRIKEAVVLLEKEKEEFLQKARSDKEVALNRAEDEKKAVLAEAEKNFESELAAKVAEYEEALRLKHQDILQAEADKQAALQQAEQEKAAELRQAENDKKQALEKEKSLSARYRKNIIFLDELKGYAEKAISLLEAGDEIVEKSCLLFKKWSDDKSDSIRFHARALGKFTAATAGLPVGEWREQLKYIVTNGMLAVSSDGYASIRQLLDREAVRKAEEFEKVLFISLFRRYCNAVLILLEETRWLALQSDIDLAGWNEMRREFRQRMCEDLNLSLNDAFLLEASENKHGIQIEAKAVSDFPAKTGQIIEILSYGIGREGMKIDFTRVIINQ